MTEFENLSTSEKVRVALHRDINSISKECCHYRGLEITIQAMAIIAELVYKKLSVYGSDLEAFAKHAKRSVVNSEDGQLLVRRNPSLKAHLNKLSKNKSAAKELKRRQTLAAKPKSPKKKTNIISDDSDDCIEV